MENKKKNKIVLIVGMPTYSSAKNLIRARKNQKNDFLFVMINANKPKNKRQEKIFSMFDITLVTKFDSPDAIRKVLLHYLDDIIAVTSLQESKIPLLQKVVPLVPYLNVPTSESLGWSIDKIEMRKRFRSYDKSITPRFTVVKDSEKKTLNRVHKKVGYPVIVKPSGLAGSRLVNICYHEEELESSLKKVFRKITRSYKKFGDNKIPGVLVEQFMEGEMYTTDIYVNAKGVLTFCPMVHVKTGRTIGFDDFFGYRRITPTKLSSKSIEGAHEATKKGVHALGLRSCTGHVELLKTEDGWKIIEIGPRIGGFRDKMYKLSFGIDHTGNDIVNRMGQRIAMPKKKLGYSSVLQFYAPKEGIITSIRGLIKARKLESLRSIKIKRKIGDKAIYAKNGGGGVFDVVLFNEDRSKLLADIRRLEQGVKIKTTTK